MDRKPINPKSFVPFDREGQQLYSQVTLSDELLSEQAHKSLKSAANYSLDQVTENGYWCTEVHSTTTFTSEYIYLRQQFGLTIDPTETEALTLWLFSKQKNDGSWGLAPSCTGDVPTTTETYLALKILGTLPDEPRMQAARVSITKFGRLPATRMFTRVFLASLGLISWRSPCRIDLAADAVAHQRLQPFFVGSHHVYIVVFDKTPRACIPFT